MLNVCKLNSPGLHIGVGKKTGVKGTQFSLDFGASKTHNGNSKITKNQTKVSGLFLIFFKISMAFFQTAFSF